jgi:glycosyltransferase involved in cell wall biosynthesis
MVSRARVITACSHFALEDLQEFAKPTCPSLVIPNGVDPEEFANRGRRAIRFGRYILGVGRLVPQKGFDVLLEAFAITEVPGMRLVIAGEGFERENLVRRAAELGIVDRVDLVGAVGRKQLVALMLGATAFALPSRGEAFGIALLEAMAAGVPAVAAASGGVPEMARDGENAIVVDVENPGALSFALARLIDDPELRAKLSAGGRKTARELAWTRIVERYDGVYEQARAGIGR